MITNAINEKDKAQLVGEFMLPSRQGNSQVYDNKEIVSHEDIT